MSSQTSISHPLAQLRQLLREAGFTSEAIELAAVFPAVTGPNPVERALERTEERSTLHTLIKLFVVGANVPVDSAAEALSPVSVEHLVACGLLERVGEQVRSFAALDPFGDLLIAHDFRSRRQGLGETGDSVLGVGSSTRYLAAITVRRGGETVLDLGTGQGFQSLLAASHARRVIGTDLNPRTLRFAAISAALNSQTIELREGSLFEPISELEGAFHLIVSNLPFVISPRRNLIAFSGNSEGDSLVERVIRQTPSYLSEGGFACFLGSWGHQESSDWSNRPREWTSGNDCDVLLLRSRAQSARQYAVQWIDESEGVVGIGSVPPLSQWLSYFDQLGYRHFSMGAVIMRKRTEGSNWFAAEGGLDKPPPPAGDQIIRIFDGRTHLAKLGSLNELLDCPLKLAVTHELVEHRRCSNGRWQSASLKLRQTDGFEFPLGIDLRLAELLAACDGVKTPRRIVMEATRARGGDSPRALLECAAFLRRALELGYLSPVGKPPSK